ncbi:MAG: rhamnulokinase family protein [Salinivenus sp.]
MPDSSHHLAVDLGASSGRALLGTLRDGRVEVTEVHRFETPMIEDGDRLYWDLAALEAEVEEGVREGLDAAPALRSVSVDSWAVDYVPLDAEGQPLRNPRCYRDPRTQDVMEDVLDPETREAIYATTGIQFLPINTLYQVLSDQRAEPSLVEQTALRLPIADYLQYRLSGEAVVERSMASTTQLLDVRTGDWATALMERFDIDPGTWPRVVPPATRLGPLKGAPNSQFDTRNSTVEVVAGCTHDTACAVAATPAVPDGPPWAYISCGTWSLLGTERDAPVLTDAAREAGFTNELGLDGTVRFLKNLTGLWVLQECERAWTAEGQQFDYDTLQREARAAASLGTIDLDEPRFLERGGMPRKIEAYCREHDQPVPETRGAFVRLILESLAADYRDKLALLEDVIDERIEVVHLMGGGARNELLCQWTADATGRRVVAGPAEATALGNLLIQARATNGLPDGVPLRDVVRASTPLRTYEPASSTALRD